MCLISKHIEARLKGISSLQRTSKDFKFEVLTSTDFKKPSKAEMEKIGLLFKEFKSFKKSLRDGTLEGTGFESFTTNEQIASHIHTKGLNTISSNASHLADIAVYFCYNVSGSNSKSFAWQVFGNDIVDNIRKRKRERFVRVPMPSEKGDIEYLWQRYGMYLLNVERLMTIRKLMFDEKVDAKSLYQHGFQGEFNWYKVGLVVKYMHYELGYGRDKCKTEIGKFCSKEDETFNQIRRDNRKRINDTVEPSYQKSI